MIICLCNGDELEISAKYLAFMLDLVVAECIFSGD